MMFIALKVIVPSTTIVNQVLGSPQVKLLLEVGKDDEERGASHHITIHPERAMKNPTGHAMFIMQ